MRALRETGSPLIGREVQLRALAEAVAAAGGGRGRLLLLSGEPGIGKTRLAEETAAAAQQAGLSVLWGRCHEIGGRPPLWPWIQILRAHALAVGPAQCADELDVDVQPLAMMVPELAPLLHLKPATLALESDASRFRFFLAVTAMLGRIARARPVLLVLDDLHWADMTSLRLLDFLSYELSQVPIAVIGTYREFDVRQTPSLAEIVAGLLRRGHSMALTGLSRDEAARFVAGASRHKLSEAAAARLHAITEGNPFFLDEMVRMIDVRGGELPASGWSVPDGVLGTIRERLRGLTAEVHAILAAGAVVGREFDLAMVAAMLGTPAAKLHDRLRVAIDHDVVRSVAERPGVLRFAHGLVQEAIRAELPPARRAELHRLCGETLAARASDASDTPLSRVAHHFFEASAHVYDARALEFAARAGEQAMRALAFEDAALQFSRCLNLLDRVPQADPARRCGLLLRLGEATNRAAQGPESAAAFEQAAALARRIASPVSLAHAAIGLCGVGATWAQYGRYDVRLVAGLREALDGLPPEEVGLRARVLARLAAELHFAPTREDTTAMSAEAVRLARAAGETATLVYTLPARLRCSTPEDRDERRAIVDEILRLNGGRGELAVHAYVWRLSEALQAGALSEVEVCRQQLAGALRELRQPRDLWLLPVLESQAAVLEGRIADAERCADEVMAHEGLTANGRMTALVLLFVVRREQGRLGELTEGLRSFAYQSATVSAWRTNLAQLYAETGAVAAAQAELEVLIDDDLGCLRRDNTWMLGAAGLAGAAALVGRPDQVAAVYRALLPYDGRHVTAASFFYFGPVAYYLGILARRQADGAAALRHLDDALAAARSLGAVPYVARALIAKAAVLARGDDDAAAAAAGLRVEARRLAEAYGLTAIARELGEAEDGGGSAVGSDRDRIARLRCKGEAWELSYQGRTSLLKSRRGIAHLARLLDAPDRELHVFELSGGGAARSGGVATAPLLDARAKNELRRRVAELRREVDDAEMRGAAEAAAAAQAEIEAIAGHLSRSLGLGGRDRRMTSDAERARAAVTKAVRAAIRQIAGIEADLAAVLARTIQTGVFCCYRPLGEVRISWVIEGGVDPE